MASILSKRFHNNSYPKNHHNHFKHNNTNSVKIEDSIVAGVTRYNITCKNRFGNGFTNLSICGYHVRNGLRCARDILFLPFFKNVLL